MEAAVDFAVKRLGCSLKPKQLAVTKSDLAFKNCERTFTCTINTSKSLDF